MRVRTTLAAGVLAVTALMGSAGSALANDNDYRHEGGYKACGQFAGTGHQNTFWADGCAQGHWMKGANSEHRYQF